MCKHSLVFVSRGAGQELVIVDSQWLPDAVAESVERRLPVRRAGWFESGTESNQWLTELILAATLSLVLSVNRIRHGLVLPLYRDYVTVWVMVLVAWYLSRAAL